MGSRQNISWLSHLSQEVSRCCPSVACNLVYNVGVLGQPMDPISVYAIHQVMFHSRYTSQAQLPKVTQQTWLCDIRYKNQDHFWVQNCLPSSLPWKNSKSLSMGQGNIGASQVCIDWVSPFCILQSQCTWLPYPTWHPHQLCSSQSPTRAHSSWVQSCDWLSTTCLPDKSPHLSKLGRDQTFKGSIPTCAHFSRDEEFQIATHRMSTFCIVSWGRLLGIIAKRNTKQMSGIQAADIELG